MRRATAYSQDLRERVIEMVGAGETARGAAEHFKVSASTAIKWAQRWRRTGSVAALPRTGRVRSPLHAHTAWLLALVEQAPDLTLEDIRCRLAGERAVSVGISSVWRFFARAGISFKKNAARRRTGESRRCSRA